VTLRRVLLILAVEKQSVLAYILRVRVYNLAFPACKGHVPCCIFIFALSDSTTFFHIYLLNCTIFGRKLPNMKCVFWFSLNLLFEIFLIPRTERDMIESVYWSSRSTCHSCQILMKVEFLGRCSKDTRMSNFTQYVQWETSCSVRTDGQTDRHDEANSRFSKCWVSI
jgi:hypothetical protein